MKMYEAAPGHWLCEGVSMAEHEAAMAGNYTGDDLSGYGDFLFETLARKQLKQAAVSKMQEHDSAGVWRTRDRHLLPIAEIEDSHLENIVRMLERSGFDTKTCVPNLIGVA
jgi:hypothetical protein